MHKGSSHGSDPTQPAVGFGPNAGGTFSQEDYQHRGAAISVSKVLLKEHELLEGPRVVFKMNHENGGYDCPGCAWPDDRKNLRMDICEHGIKHATWEMTPKRVGRAFFAAHTATELMGWSDFALEDAGRLTEPMRYEAASDKYVPISWQNAFELVDWEKADCLIILGVNAASNAPRMLTSLAEAYRHGARTVHVNPFIEAASRNTIVPHELDKIHALDEVYRQSRATVIAWCLGVTQQEHAVDTVREIVNVLLMRGNLGREGAGPCPIRGHSNVQGNRTCGIDHQPSEEWLARLDRACSIKSPQAHGLDTVRVIAAMRRGEVKVFLGMGGNFVRAVPDPAYTFPAVQNCELTVQVSTKVDRSHLVHGREALILPCLGRTEKDHGRKGLQGVTVEDAMSMVHLSYGMKEPCSPQLRSETAIIAGIAQAALPNTATPWQAYADDYNLIRDKMAEAIAGFECFNRRVRQPLGFRLKQPARELVFQTETGRANFSSAALAEVAPPAGRLLLGTVRSHDQWNTTIYSDDDRYRGVKNLRTLVFMNPEDLRERGLKKYDLVDIKSFAKDGSTRQVFGYRVLPYNLPAGCAIGYVPELNVLCPIGDYSAQSDQPLMKHIVVEITPSKVPASREPA